MRILHVVPTYFPATRYGGTIYSVHGMCKALSHNGHDVHVYTTNVDGSKNSQVPLTEPVDLDGVKVWYFPCQFLRRYYWSSMMSDYLKRHIHEFDVIHIHAMYLYPVYIAARIAREFSIPYVISPRGMLVKNLIQRKNKWLKTAWLQIFGKKIINNADVIHVTSMIEAEELKKFRFKTKRVVIIPNGVEDKILDMTEKESPDIRAIVSNQPLILSLGRINWKKGLEILIQSMKDVSTGHLAIVGNDEEKYAEKLLNLVAKHKLQDRISILPREVKGSDKQLLFQKAKVFTLVSVSENFGNVALEAMSYCCPVISTVDVGISEIVNAYKAGIVTARSSDDISHSLNEILKDENMRLTMATNACNAVKKKYTWDALSERFIELYSELRNKNC